MDQVIKALALLIEKKVDMTGLTVEDVILLNEVKTLAQGIKDEEPDTPEVLNSDIIQAIRRGYEEYLVGRIIVSYSLADWFAHTSGKELTDEEVTSVLEADAEVVYGIFAEMCNHIITSTNKERA